MCTVPAHSLLAPTFANVMAAARSMPGVCGVLRSNSPARTTRTPSSRPSVLASLVVMACAPAASVLRAAADQRGQSTAQRRQIRLVTEVQAVDEERRRTDHAAVQAPHLVLAHMGPDLGRVQGRFELAALQPERLRVAQ